MGVRGIRGRRGTVGLDDPGGIDGCGSGLKNLPEVRQVPAISRQLAVSAASSRFGIFVVVLGARIRDWDGLGCVWVVGCWFS